MTERSKFYLTTAIPYVNASPHLGHAFEYIQTDLLARGRRQRGCDVHFLTGTDDNSLKNVQAAEAEGVPTGDLVARNSQRFIDMIQTLGIANDGFIHTASPEHFAGCQKIWSACRPEDIYKKSYHGLYCVGCEAFYNEADLVDGKCPEHQRPLELIEEENYFFRLSAYQEQLEELIASDAYRIAPEMRKNEVLSFIRMGLEDFSISRSQARAHNWGVPVPGDPSQVMYVWFDALSNYLTGLGYGSADESGFNKYWPCDLHVVGKGIIRFHAVYWPAMLLSAGIALPKALFVHGYVNLSGSKMSKSSGAVIDPFELVEKYGVNPVRWYLVRHLHPVQDSDFSIEALEAAYNADLANGIGNLTARSLTMIEKNGGGEIKPAPCAGEAEQAVQAKFAEVWSEFERLMDNFEFSQAYAKVWEAETALDKYITDKKPWEIAKDPARRAELDDVYYTLAEGLRMLASLVYPAMPSAAEEIWRRLGLTQGFTEISWDEQKRWGLLTAGLKITKGDPLFPRLA